MFKTTSSWEIHFSFLVEHCIYLYGKAFVDEHFVEEGSCERVLQPWVLFALCMCMDWKEKTLAFISAKISYK